MFTNFGHLPIYAMEQVLTTDGSELLPASDRKKSPMSSARIEASDRAEHHQRSLGTCWRRCADSWFRMPFAPFARRFCLFISARWAGTVPGLLPRYAKSLGTLSPSSNGSATVVQSHIIPWSNFILVGGIPTPLKKLSLSVGIIIPNLWKVIKSHGSKPPNQTSYQPGHIDPHNIFIFHYNTI